MRGRLAPAVLALAAAAAVVGAGGCCCGAPAAFTARRPLAPAAEAGPPPLTGPVLRALHFGDFGDDTCQQREVARALAAAHARAPFDLAFHAGDNVYECGPDVALPGAERCAFAADDASVAPGFSPPADPRFAAKLETPLAFLAAGAAPVPVYLALGNHDIASCDGGGLPLDTLRRRKACLEVAHASALWHLPARHYAVDRGPARFIVLDSNLLLGDYGGFTIDGEVAFVRAASAGCDARPCFIVSHHPPATAALHRTDATPEYIDRVRRVQEVFQGPVAGWLAAHDHDLQHLRAAAGYDVFVSGNGSRGRPEERFAQVSVPAAQLLFASTAWGFSTLEVAGQRWRVRFESTAGEPLHCCEATFPGACQPVACPPPSGAR
ncbi:MAG: metallophosphoesterase [Anaeromyxobacteraceae bacterium]